MWAYRNLILLIFKVTSAPIGIKVATCQSESLFSEAHWHWYLIQPEAQPQQSSIDDQQT